MAIINPLPYTIVNGNPVDATPVESNFNQIVNNVNANAAPVGGNASQQFLVASTTNPAGAVPLAQLQNGSISPTFGTTVVANATASGDAINLGQLQNGSISPTFGATVVANATASNQAVTLAQLQTLGVVTNSTVSYSASTTLTAANQGQIVFYTGSAAATFTLPAANALPGYQCKIVISNQSSYPLTVAVPSGNGTDLNPNVLQPNQYCCVANDGGTIWHTLWNNAGSPSPFVVGNATASNQAVNLGQSTASASVYNVTSSRSLGTTYTNSHGKQLTLGVTGTVTTTNGNLVAYVNGVSYTSFPQIATNTAISVTAVVPPGATYEVASSNSGASVASWIEEY
jgi:hypothetical protein